MARIAPFENYSDDYDKWFTDNSSVYELELEAVREFIPLINAALMLAWVPESSQYLSV